MDKMDAAGFPPVAQDIVDKELLALDIEANLMKLTAASRKVYYRQSLFVNAQIEGEVLAKRAKTIQTTSAPDDRS